MIGLANIELDSEPRVSASLRSAYSHERVPDLARRGWQLLLV